MFHSFIYFFRVSAAEETYSDSDFSQDAFSVDVQWSSDGVCPDLNETHGTERDQRRSAGRKLIVACAVSLVFMTGEVIGKMKQMTIPEKGS